MALAPKRLVSGSQLTTSAATYYTAGTGVKARIDSCALTNTSGSSATVTLYLVPSGGSAAASNTVLSAYSINAGQTYLPPGVVGQWLESGGTIQALASAGTAITMIMSGAEFTGN